MPTPRVTRRSATRPRTERPHRRRSAISATWCRDSPPGAGRSPRTNGTQLAAQARWNLRFWLDRGVSVWAQPKPAYDIAVAAISDNVAAVRAEIGEACRRSGRDPSAVRLIAVTKQQSPGALVELASLGIADVGENRVDHLRTMHAAAPDGMRFHFIGRLQSRQLAEIAERSRGVHGLCDAGHAERLGRILAGLAHRLEVFIQVNVSGEETKAGVAPDRVSELVATARAMPALEVVGLMTMAPPPEQASAADIRRCFADLRRLSERHDLPRLSMGMSSDFTVAIEEGATDVRIGTRLFSGGGAGAKPLQQ